MGMKINVSGLGDHPPKVPHLGLSHLGIKSNFPSNGPGKSMLSQLILNRGSTKNKLLHKVTQKMLAKSDEGSPKANDDDGAVSPIHKAFKKKFKRDIT
jgi:hypothetical protein